MFARQYELPLVGRIAAGSPITAEQNIDDWVRVDPALFHPRADFMHEVRDPALPCDVVDNRGCSFRGAGRRRRFFEEADLLCMPNPVKGVVVCISCINRDGERIS